MVASSPLAASSDQPTGGFPTAPNTGGQVTRATNTPIQLPSSFAPAKPVPNLFDPSHIPTLYTRIQSISRLLIDASKDPNSLTIPQQGQLREQEQNAQSSEDRGGGDSSNGAKRNPSLSSTSNQNGPDIAMGATTEDDVANGYEAALALSLESGRPQENVKRTELAFNLVKESQGLRNAFHQAREAISGLQGGDMDIEEQEQLIEVLQNYSQQQR
ncbi:hypothetical protein CBS101457_006112 [Exobasidium rhododendri]|nr:hypothetical protein CBS101457_006112 [Exobasidium rhododendri]